MKTENRTFMCQLTEEELRNCGDQMAAAQLKAEELQADLKKTTSDYKESIKTEKNVVSVCAQLIEDKAEERDIECTLDVKGDEVIVTRSDTGEEVERRPLTDEERQGNLFDDEPAAGLEVVS